MNVLSVVVCYNLHYLMRNTLESLLEFFPIGDVLVIDNGSTNPELIEYLRGRELTEPRLKVVFRDYNDHTSKTGSLYDANNWAIEYSIENGYEFVYFVQDDVQFLWTDPEILTKIAHIYENEKGVSNISAVFPKKYNDYRIHIYEADSTNLSYINRTSGVSDEGFFKVSWLAEKNFRFMTFEREHSLHWLEQGYNMRFLRDPYIAFVPWPATRRAGKIIGTERRPVENYFLRQLDEVQIESLTSRPVTEIPFTDDYCFPWGYACLTPFWFTTPDVEYFHLLFDGRLSARKSIRLPRFETRGLPSPDKNRMWRQISILFGDHDPSLLFMVQIWIKQTVTNFLVRNLGLKRTRALVKFIQAPLRRPS